MKSKARPKSAAPPARKATERQTSRKGETTRQRILDVAAARIAALGYSQAKLSDIAEDAGIHLSAFYYYFDTKEELATALLVHLTRQGAGALEHAVTSLPAGAPPLERLKAAIRAYLHGILRRDDYGRAHLQIAQQASHKVNKRALEIVAKENALLKQLVEDAARAGILRPDIDLTLSRMILMGAMNWAVEWFREGPSSVDDFADHIILIILGGMTLPRQDDTPPT